MLGMSAANTYSTENNQRQVFLTMVEHHENGDPRVTIRQDQRERGVPTEEPGHETVRQLTHRAATIPHKILQCSWRLCIT